MKRVCDFSAPCPYPQLCIPAGRCMGHQGDQMDQDWRRKNLITDWEFTEVGALLCRHSPRDLALMIVRLQGEMEVARLLATPRRAPFDARIDAVHREISHG